ncbi:MAG TPA: ROK family protein [Planctomycetales bacterium]|jgi:glucokinase|nr:ROK family protein [Planctomycetales bacterium]
MGYYLGIEIGGTKLQMGVGADDGVLAGLWRGAVDTAAGPEGIRRQITQAVPELLAKANIDRSRLKGVGVGFGGPVDDATRTVIKSHQIEGWDDFPLADWVSEVVGLPAVLGNDADVAGLAEALHGAGKGISPIFYITIGSGIGGGFIIDGEIYRGVGKGAAEIGHLRMFGKDWEAGDFGSDILENVASGWSIGQMARTILCVRPEASQVLLRSVEGKPERITAWHVGQAAQAGDDFARSILLFTLVELAEAVCHAITLLCPRRIVIGGGVALLGEAVLFEPLRELVAQRVFKPFAGLTEILPAALGEEVVVHGAIALARRKLVTRE